MNNFGKLHEQFRLSKNISRAELAQYIQKDPSYIRRIEIENYVPQFNICEEISNKLELTSAEKLSLYKEAFYKRIESDLPYYRTLLALESGQKKGSEIHQNFEFPLKKGSFNGWKFNCTYWISWHTKSQSEVLLSPVDQAVENFLRRTIQDLELQCYNISISPERINLLIEITPNYKLEDLISNLKQLSSGFLHTKFPNLDAPPDIWDETVMISTIGAIPEELKLKEPISTQVSQKI